MCGFSNVYRYVHIYIYMWILIVFLRVEIRLLLKLLDTQKDSYSWGWGCKIDHLGGFPGGLRKGVARVRSFVFMAMYIFKEPP